MDEKYKHGHHHNGNQAARRPRMMCSICGRQCTTPLFAVRGDWNESVASPCIPISSPLTYMVYLFPFLSYLGWLQKRFRPSIRPSARPTRIRWHTALEAIAWSSSKNAKHKKYDIENIADRMILWRIATSLKILKLLPQVVIDGNVNHLCDGF